MDASGLVQGSDEWRKARLGSLGASQVHEALAKIKTGWGASRANVMAALIAERLTGSVVDGYTNAAMQHGTDTEPEARAAYEWLYDCEVVQIGLDRHPTIAWSHASPDGLVGSDGLVEFKCPTTATHIETLLGGSVPGRYITQVQWQMACRPERKWVDWCSFDNRLPESMRLFVRRIARDDKHIADLEKEVVAFIAEVDRKVAELTARYGQQRAA